jgi:hypothetical protein
MSKFVLLSLLLSTGHVRASTQRDPNYCDSENRCQQYNVAHSFVSWEKLTAEQSRILVNSGFNESIYETWTANHDDQAAAFLAVTDSLSHLKMKLSDGVVVQGDQLIIRIKRFEGDRIIATFDEAAFSSWRNAQSPFELVQANGKTESGKMKFRDHSWLGGSLHKGYDIQGFTSVTKVPRIQIRFGDSYRIRFISPTKIRIRDNG